MKEEDGIILEHGGNASRSVATVVKAFAVSHRSAFHDVDSSIKVAIRYYYYANPCSYTIFDSCTIQSGAQFDIGVIVETQLAARSVPF